MLSDIFDYFERHERECERLGIVEIDEFLRVAEKGSNDCRGQIFGNASLGPRAFLSIHEVVLVENGIAVREEYGYFLVIDELEVWGYENDPTHDPAVHAHGRDHRRYASEELSFATVVEKAWEAVERAEKFGVDDLDPIGEDGEPI